LGIKCDKVVDFPKSGHKYDVGVNNPAVVVGVTISAALFTLLGFSTVLDDSLLLQRPV